MARTRFIFFSKIQSILNLKRFPRQQRQKWVAIFLALLTFISALTIPALLPDRVIAKESQIQQSYLLIAEASKALELEQHGQEYYNTGRFAEAAQAWQTAADAYEKDGDGKARNLINKAKALQSLGLYSDACNTLLPALGIDKYDCATLIKLNKVNSYEAKNPQSFQDSTMCEITEARFKFWAKYPKNITLIKQIYTPFNNLNKVISLRRLGELFQRLDDLNLAQVFLELSKSTAEQYPEEKSATLLSLANAERAKITKMRNKLNYETTTSQLIQVKDCQTPLKIYESVFSKYQEAAQLSTNKIVQIQAKLNELSLLLDIQEWSDEQVAISNYQNKWPDFFTTLLNKRLQESIKILPKNKFSLINSLPSRDIVETEINLAYTLMRLKDRLKQPQIAEILADAIKKSRQLEDKYAESEALSNLARLYELQVSKKAQLAEQDKLYLAQAKNLIEQALNLSDNTKIDNRQILYRHRHQLGRILKAEGNIQAAIASYAEAWNILQSLRADLVSNTDNQFYFRREVEPIYREFIDLLLQAEDRQIDVSQLVLLNNDSVVDQPVKTKAVENTSASYLARFVMESLQLAELDNFLQEPCSPALVKPVQIDNIDPKAAVIYPIILEDRLEVIVSMSGQPSRHWTAKVNQGEVKETLDNLARLLSSNESELKTIKTISQKIYNWLIKPELVKQLDRGQINTLVFVLDRPFQKIPIAALFDGKKYLIEKYNVVLNIGQQITQPKRLKEFRILAAELKQARILDEYDFPKLENKEVSSIEDLAKNLALPLDKIPNNDFTKKILTEKIKFAPAIVHIATHGIFSSNPDKTFIVTKDSTININDFDDVFNPKNKIRKEPIELLVFSACKTASGDDKAALGMAGVALKSGANSTIGSLWLVSDEATGELMTEFYNNLIQKKINRAEAIKKAQISLLKDNKYNHPYYWAAFVLVGNWL
ncbi:MAG TPA: CHAT domain-containing protein [Oculatellaceae cyanobacterium]|jgi:CHAT domain-containing protein